MPPSRPLAVALALAAFAAPAAARADGKFALGMFHFNVQYVAGGMVGYYAVPNPGIDFEAEQIEDAIVTESFQPVLELYQKHPGWGVDLELQGYMLDVIAARHPATLELLRALAKSGQIEVPSFHYSDQLFIAHPYDDWSRSQARTAATFAKYDIPLGTSVFCQEGQSGEIMAREMKSRGYETMVWPKNLWIYQHGDFAAAPLYTFGEVSLIVGGQGVSYQGGGSTIEVQWTFFDDGEKLATGGFDPYFPDLFHRSQKALDKYESDLTAMEAQGFSITTVSKYVAKVKGTVTPAAPPPLLDGTWQPGSTGSSHKWLGGGGLWSADERDNHVRSLANTAHREIAAAEAIAGLAGIDAAAAIDDAERLLSLGEVSDATGINPFRGEVEYGIAHIAEALRIARDVIRDGKDKLGLGSAIIDPQHGTAREGQADALRGKPAVAPIALVIDPGDRMVTQRWEAVAPGLHRVELAFGVGNSSAISVRFPGGAGDDLVTTRALDDTAPATVKRSDFSFDDIYLPLPIGLVSLGPGVFVIEDQAYVHIAAQVSRADADATFADETATAGEPVTWAFYLFEGTPADAVATARSINDWRVLSR
jgi:hypothetical protein